MPSSLSSPAPLNVLGLVRTIDISWMREAISRGWNVWGTTGLLQQLQPRGVTFNLLEQVPTREETDALNSEAIDVSLSLPQKMIFRGDDIAPKLGGIDENLLNHAQMAVSMSGLVRLLHQKHPLDALVTWTDAVPGERAAVLTAKHLGIHTFELRHGAWAHYLQGHFECESLVDTVLSPGDEDRIFLEFYGNKNDIVVTGKPQFDWSRQQDGSVIRKSFREHLQIPDERPVVMYCGTWRHQFDYWEFEDPEFKSLKAVLEAHKQLQEICNPHLVIKIHPQVSGLIKTYKDFCDAMEATEYSITDIDASSILPVADVVVTHQSSVVSECMLYGIKPIVIEFRKYNDHGFFKGRGLRFCTDPKLLATEIGRVLLDAEYGYQQEEGMKVNRYFWCGPEDSLASARCCDVIQDRVMKRREACVSAQ